MSTEIETLSPTEQALRHFQADTGEHELTVLQDDGVYRHLRFKKAGTGMYWFDIHTSPGLLTIHGDMGTYVFSRERDMFGWFGGEGIEGGISYDYWAQKLVAPHGSREVKAWSESDFKQTIEQLIEDEGDELSPEDKAAFADHFREAMFEGDNGYMPDGDADAKRRLEEYEWADTDSNAITFSDVWEYEFLDYEFNYLWCCWAIVWGIQKYRAEATLPVGATNTGLDQTLSTTPEARS